MRILVAEDEAVTLRRIQYFLEKFGHIVITAKNGREALDIFLKREIDIIITDWMMPEMDGLELVSNVRSIDTHKAYVYVILLTAKGEKQDVVKALSGFGVDDYIVKPFDPDELRARLNVGERIVLLEKNLREHNEGLENIVRWQTQVIRQTNEEIIIRLLTALESRDEETGGHVRRIALYSALLAKAAGWPDDKIDDLRMASPMHDIGKIGIPDEVLHKKGPLTSTEFDIIKLHTTVGGQILGRSEFPMIQMAYDIAYYHHANWDGTGYPKGPSGEDIPEAARIVSLVDVYDAMSHDRVYRKALPEEDVIQFMEKGRGTRFDPHYYDLFMTLLPEFRRISMENP